jgi:hypothetical protein
MKTLTLTQTAQIAEFSRVFAKERFGVAVKVKITPATDRKTIVRRCVVFTVVASVGTLYAVGLLYFVGSFGV